MSEEPDWQAALRARGGLGMIRTLDAVRAGYAALGSPGAQVPVVRVVGTNGKGSTAAMTAHVLGRYGLRVGLYTSPHLHRVAERIRVDGQPLADAALRAIVERVLACEGQGLPRPLTFFEILTLAGLVASAEAGCEVMVLETGMGGRDDATSVLPATVTLMAPIALDHQAFLGSTLAAIAGEKAAVMRAGAPVFSAGQAPEVAEVLVATAQACGAPLQFVAPLARAPEGLPGAHQRGNGALALAGAAAILAQLRPDAPAPTIADLDGVRWPGRCERVACGGGTVVFDVAHNPHGVLALASWLEGQERRERVIVFGCLADKDGSQMVRILARLGAPLWLVPPGPGAYALEELAGPGRIVFAGPDDPRLRAAWADHLARGGEIVVCGSHGLVGRLRAEALGEATDAAPLVDPVARERERP